MDYFQLPSLVVFDDFYITLNSKGHLVNDGWVDFISVKASHLRNYERVFNLKLLVWTSQ